MAQLFYISLSKLIEVKDNYFLIGDLNGWFRGLWAIYRRIYFKVKKEEKDIEYLNGKFEIARNNLNCVVPKNVSNSRATQETSIFTVLNDIDTKLTEVLDKYDMIFPDVSTMTGSEYLGAKYNLKNGVAK